MLRASSPGSRSSSTSCDTDRWRGSSTSTVDPPASRARSASSRSTSMRHSPARSPSPIGSVSAAARTSTARASTAPRRPGVRSPGYGPSGSSGHTLARASAVTGLISSGSGSLHSRSLANGRTQQGTVKGRAVSGRYPKRSRRQQHRLRPSQRNIGQPRLLLGMPFDERLVVREQACVHLLAIGRPVEVQSRQIVTLTAQRPGQFVPRAPSSATWHRTGTRHQPVRAPRRRPTQGPSPRGRRAPAPARAGPVRRRRRRSSDTRTGTDHSLEG